MNIPEPPIIPENPQLTVWLMDLWRALTQEQVKVIALEEDTEGDFFKLE
jgi:hypothetical protein